MAPKRKGVPPIKPNSDGSGFVRVGAAKQSHGGGLIPPCRSVPAGAARPGGARDAAAPGRSSSSSAVSSGTEREEALEATRGRAQHSQRIPRHIHESGQGKQHARSEAAHPITEAPGGTVSSQRGSADVVPIASSSGSVYALRSDASLGPNECRLSPGGCKKLKVVSGSVIRLSSSKATVYVEVFLSSGGGGGGSSDTVIVGEDTAALLLDPQVRVCSLGSSGAGGLVEAVTVSVFVERGTRGNDSGSGADGGGFEPAPASALSWRALFRRAFGNRLVFAGMRASLPLSTFTVALEVTQLAVEPSSSHAAFGLLAPSATIHIGSGCEAAVGVGGDAHPAGGQESWNEDLVFTTHQGRCANTGHVLVIGDSGTGKTRFLEREATLDCEGRRRRVFHVRMEDLPQGEGSEVTTGTVLREIFAEAARSSPATVILDDLHLLCGSSGGSSSSGSQWAVALFVRTLCDELRAAAVQRGSVRVLASAPSRDALPASLITPSRLGAHVVELYAPASAEERQACLASCLQEAGTTAGSVSDEVVHEVAATLHGFTQRDIHRVVQAALLASFETRGTTHFTAGDLHKAAKHIHPSCLRQFEVAIPDVTWGDIGGSEEAKSTLRDVVEWCLGKQAWIFREFRLRPPKGVLLYGPPGCSKTMLAKALANESRMNFISVKGPEVFSKWVGDSEKAVREIFAKARAAAPCVVFIDELDGMCSHRGRGGVADRVIAQFLTELDGLPAALEDKTNALVFVAATNRPDNIDGAVLRPGRIDRRVYVGLPTLAEREMIAAIQFRRIPTSPALSAHYVAAWTEGYTGAEVVAVVKEAAFIAISNSTNAAHIDTADVDAALRKIRPRVAPQDVEWYKQWQHKSTSAENVTATSIGR